MVTQNTDFELTALVKQKTEKIKVELNELIDLIQPLPKTSPAKQVLYDGTDKIIVGISILERIV